MEHKTKVKEVFEVEKIHKEFFTGGLIKVTKDGRSLFSQCSSYITVVNVESVSIERTIPPNLNEFNSFAEEDNIDDPILTFALSADEKFLGTGHKSGLIKVWNLENWELVTAWKGVHKGPIILLAFNSNNSHFTSGSTDSVIKVWNMCNHSCDFKLGGLTGVTSILEYCTIDAKEYLFASADEAVIRGWYFQSGAEPQLVFKLSGHFSRITKIIINDYNLISCSRDKAVIVWDLNSKKQLRTIPVYESLETGTLLPGCINLPGHEKPVTGTLVAFGGEHGNIRILNVVTGQELYTHGSDGRNNSPITYLIYVQNIQGLFDIRANQNISIYNFDHKFSCRNQMIGYLDEIFDIAYFGEEEEYLAVAANSCDIHIYDKNMNCSLVKGHTDLVVSLATSRSIPNLLVSGSKDNSVRVWMMKANISNCVAVGARHTASVGSISLSSSQNTFIVSVSEDATMKLWQLPILKYKKCESLIVTKTAIAHDKPINCVSLSPNDRLIATGSQDKTIKVWSRSNLNVFSVLRGHRRAIWSLKFSPVDQVLLSSSADATLRLWSLSDYSCLKTLEGQDCSVLSCAFINNGTQIVSSGTDGVVKLWLIKSGEVVSTLDKHSARVWALAVSADESTVVTGGADSRIIFWRDKTEETRVAEIKSNQEKIEQEQYLSNLLLADKLFPALQYAINLNQPFKVLKILESLLESESNKLKAVLEQLNVDQKEILLGYVVEWNTNTKNCFVAQLVLSFLVDQIVTNELKVSSKQLQGLIAYTNRHYDRMITHLEDVQLISYTISMMKPGI